MVSPRGGYEAGLGGTKYIGLLLPGASKEEKKETRVEYPCTDLTRLKNSGGGVFDM